ncbi:nickel-responsive transcriptional regulator NikR [Methanobacterium sp. VT]|uniref:Nickel-responsive transcriptional regulator NikR n=1 Tax=Methanobacterium spitsbergense TaxID=2874285 RepID=A0A8T5UKW5_9EURY|nr:nickel-responsive transcriptional regulator NikR [Methanobacterium spitsbergense]
MSLPTKLLNKFDNMLGDRRYRSRSNGVQDAMKNYIEQYESINEIKGEEVGTIFILYDHHSRVLENIICIQNEYHMYINSVMHTHVTDNQSLEVIIVKGDIKYITNISDKLMGLNGVEEVKLTTILIDSK